ncbi:MAG: hypothetical protein K9J84_09910, partial [Bacteroidia bacterium]|nr:hypothetical protein [Bacteroidia bacterium]
MNKVGYIGAGVGVLALAAMANAINKSKDLNAKLKLNTLTPGNISANLGTFQVTGNFPIELVNQSSFDITLSNLYVNIAHKNEASQWEDLLIQKNGISQVTFKKNVATKLGTIPLSMAFSKIPSLIKIITGKLPRTLLVTTRFEVAGFELDPIQTEIDATSYLQPVTAVLKSFGLLNGSGAGIGYSSGVDSSGYQPAGIGYNSNYHYRKIKDATDYVGLMPVPKGGEMEIRNNGTAYDTIDDMAKIVSKTLDQTKKLSAKLKSPNQEQSVKNVWEFLYHHIQYKQDTQGVEELRDPARSFADRKTGIDCDCFSIFASSILTNMGIDHYIEMCAIHPDPWFKHVYVIVPKEPKANISQRQNYWVVDACLHKFDQLAPNISQKYSKQMRTVNLNGLGAACACKTSAPKGTFGKQPKVIQAPDKAKLNEMALHVLEPMKQQLIATKQQAIQNPGSVELLYKPAELVKAIDFALVNWGHPDNRDKALSILAQQEDSVINKVSVNGLMGIGAMQSLNGLAYDPTKVYPVFGFAGYGLDGLGSIQVTELTGLFSSIKKTAENVGNAVKNVATKAVETVKANPVAQTVQKATQTASNAIKSAASFVKQNVQKVNPIMVTARTAYRGLVSLNFRGQATKLAKGMSTPEGLKKLQNFWTSELIGGNWGDLVAAINAGKSKKELLGGIDGLGVVVAATVAASVARATPILI